MLLLIIIVEYILSSALNRDDQLDDKIANHYLTDFTMTETNKKGEISWILDGKRLENQIANCKAVGHCLEHAMSA